MGEFLADTQGTAGDPKSVGSEGRTVVGDHALDSDAQRGEVLGGSLHEAHGAFLAFIRMPLGEGDSAVVINGDEQEFPADVVGALGSVTGDPVADPVSGRATCGPSRRWLACDADRHRGDGLNYFKTTKVSQS